MEKVTIFIKPKCNKCMIVKRFLNERKIKYKEIDISEDEDAAIYLSNDLNAKTLPVVVGKDWYVEGLDLYKLNRKINNSTREEYKLTLKKFKDLGLI
jgi:glutaredoxin-like protein NrdH